MAGREKHEMRSHRAKRNFKTHQSIICSKTKELKEPQTLIEKIRELIKKVFGNIKKYI